MSTHDLGGFAMTDVALRLKEEILRLPPDDQTALIDELMEELGYEFVEDHEAWERELERRSEELRSGKVKGIPASEVFAELRKRYE
jgi:putative addiction module component (TIGR02574 family)